MSNLTLRLLAALVGLPIVIGAAWVGGWVFGALIALCAVAAQVELYGLYRASGARPYVALGVIVGVAASLRALIPDAVIPALLVGTVLMVVYALARSPEADRPDAPLADTAATALGVLYPAFLAGGAVALREADLLGMEAFWLTMTTLVGVWASDTGAYAAGRAFGRRKLFPRVSPNKTWEGAMGGVAAALGFAALAKVTVLSGVFTWADVIVVGLCCGAASQLGDLAESQLKRAAGVKDSGTWIPGHGGMLDRIDAAVIAVALVAAYAEAVRGWIA